MDKAKNTNEVAIEISKDEETGLSVMKFGTRQPLYFREGTSDGAVINAVLIERKEYSLPPGKPRTILDIGANIGVTAVLMANTYPDAIIHCFEPEPENFNLLLKNTASYPNISCHQAALGAEDSERKLFASNLPENFGGWSLNDEAGIDDQKFVMVKTLKASKAFKDLNIENIDLIKLDVEGAEYEILNDLKTMLPTIDAVFGEAHGIDDFKMFDLLSKNFDLGIYKPMDERNYPFYARRRAVLV